MYIPRSSFAIERPRTKIMIEAISSKMAFKDEKVCSIIWEVILPFHSASAFEYRSFPLVNHTVMNLLFVRTRRQAD